MVEHTQTIRRLLPTNCLSVFDHFVGLAHTGLKMKFKLVIGITDTYNITSQIEFVLIKPRVIKLTLILKIALIKEYLINFVEGVIVIN